MKAIEEAIKNEGMNAIILSTEKNYPSQKFYEKNGFETLSELIIMAK